MAEKKTIFAGGCFWCMEHPFDQIAGVSAVFPGYSGGMRENPTYEQVSTGATGHKEVVEITYDPAKVSFATLLETFWHNIDPFDEKGQFYDKGPHYKTAVFYGDDEEKAAAEKSKAEYEKKFNRKIATEILPLMKFYPAEDYHHKYYQTNPLRYKSYQMGSGRKEKLDNIWGE